MRMLSYITDELLHFLGVVSAVLLRYDVSVPQIVYNAFHGLYLLLAHNNTTEGEESPDLFRK